MNIVQKLGEWDNAIKWADRLAFLILFGTFGWISFVQNTDLSNVARSFVFLIAGSLVVYYLTNALRKMTDYSGKQVKDSSVAIYSTFYPILRWTPIVCMLVVLYQVEDMFNPVLVFLLMFATIALTSLITNKVEAFLRNRLGVPEVSKNSEESETETDDGEESEWKYSVDEFDD